MPKVIMLQEQNQLKQGISQLEKTLQQHSSILKKQTESLSFLKQAMVDMKVIDQQPQSNSCNSIGLSIVILVWENSISHPAILTSIC